MTCDQVLEEIGVTAMAPEPDNAMKRRHHTTYVRVLGRDAICGWAVVGVPFLWRAHVPGSQLVSGIGKPV